MSGEIERCLLEKVIEQREYTLVSAVLEPDMGAEWVISDGKTKFHATMEDQEFLAAVRNRETGFYTNCGITCEVEKTTWFSMDGISTECRILRVIELLDQ